MPYAALRRVTGSIIVATLCAIACGSEQCERTWTVGPTAWAFEGTISTSARWDPDGDGPQEPVIVIGGSFSVLGDVKASGVGIFDGSTCWPLGNGFSGGSVRVLKVINGALYAGGSFTADGPNSKPLRGLAKWADGAWQEVGGGAGNAGSVGAISEYQGDLIVGGQGTAFGTLGSTNLARLRGGTWESLGYSPPVAVLAIEVFQGSLYVATQPFTDVVRKFDGSVWTSVTQGILGTPSSLATDGNRLVMAGTISRSSGTPITGFASWDGTAWSPLSNPWVTSFRKVQTVDGTIYATGQFSDQASRSPVTSRLDGDTWVSLMSGYRIGSASESNGSVTTVARLGSEVFSAGSFDLQTGGSGLARLNEASWEPIKTASDQSTRRFAEFRGKLYATGNFKLFEGVTGPGVAVWDRSSWQPFPLPLGGTPSGVGVVGDRLLIGGSFTLQDGSKTSVLSWDGVALEPMGAALGGSPTSFIEFAGTPIAAGSALVDSAPVVRWDGSQWTKLGTELGNNTSRLLIYDGKLVVVGPSNRSSGSRISAWNGSAWTALGTDSFSDACVFQGELIGARTTVTSPGVVKWTGSSWQPLGPGLSAVNANLTVAGRDLYATNILSVYWGGTSYDVGVARWNGIRWIPLDAPVLMPERGTAFGDDLLLFGLMPRASDSKLVAFASLSPAPCPADLNCDGLITFADFDDFVVAFESGDGVADRDEDGFLTFEDFDFFVSAMETGC